MADYIAISVWGYCFICYKGTPRPDNEIRQDTILTPFSCLITKPFQWRMRDTYTIMNRLLASIFMLIFPFIYMEGSVLVYNSPAEKTYADTSCFRIVKGESGDNLYEVAYIKTYTAVQSNGAKRMVYIQQYNSSWTQTRIIHIQLWDEFGNLITVYRDYSNWVLIKNGSIAASMRYKVKIYF